MIHNAGSTKIVLMINKKQTSITYLTLRIAWQMKPPMCKFSCSPTAVWLFEGTFKLLSNTEWRSEALVSHKSGLSASQYKSKRLIFWYFPASYKHYSKSYFVKVQILFKGVASQLNLEVKKIINLYTCQMRQIIYELWRLKKYDSYHLAKET